MTAALRTWLQTNVPKLVCHWKIEELKAQFTNGLKLLSFWFISWTRVTVLVLSHGSTFCVFVNSCYGKRVPKISNAGRIDKNYLQAIR